MATRSEAQADSRPTGHPEAQTSEGFEALEREQALLTKVASGSYLWIMRAVGLKVLKNRLSEYVRLVAGGETVLVTDRDRVVAELIPPRPGRSPLLADAQLAQAVRDGWLTPPVLPASDPPPRLPVAPLEDILRELREDRDER